MTRNRVGSAENPTGASGGTVRGGWDQGALGHVLEVTDEWKKMASCDEDRWPHREKLGCLTAQRWERQTGSMAALPAHSQGPVDVPFGVSTEKEEARP